MPEIYTDCEFKFKEDAGKEPEGIFEGYGAFFNNIDSHKDIIKPGAFSESLKTLKSEGRRVPMHVMHKFYGGDGLPVGVFTKIAEDAKGLRVTGKISGMNTDTGRLLYERTKDGAFGGLSIGYRVKEDGFTLGKKGDPYDRLLTKVDLKEISLVDSPSNAMTRADTFKSEALREFKELMKVTDITKAQEAIAKAITSQFKFLTGEDDTAAEERKVLYESLCDAHEALSGQRLPDGLKAAPTTVREFEEVLREKFGFSNSQARQIAEGGFKTMSTHRDDGDDAAKKKLEEENEAKAALAALL